GSPVLGLPFFDIATQQEQAAIAGAPGIFSSNLSGSLRPENISVVLSSRLQGAEGNVTANLFHECRCRLELLAGFRYLAVDDGLGIFALDGSAGAGGNTTTFTTPTSMPTSHSCDPNGPAMTTQLSQQITQTVSLITIGDVVLGSNTNINTNTN